VKLKVTAPLLHKVEYTKAYVENERQKGFKFTHLTHHYLC